MRFPLLVGVAFLTASEDGDAFYECHGESTSLDRAGNVRWTFDPFVLTTFDPRPADAPLMVGEAVVHIGRDSAMWTSRRTGALASVVQLSAD